MPERKRILVFIDWYLPGYKAGGPIRSIAAMAALLNTNADWYIVTSDRDFGSTTPYPSINYNTWNTLLPHGEKVMYLKPEEQTSEKITEIIKSYPFDLIYFNSLFSKNFTLLPLKIVQKHTLDTPLILAPRGMLGAGALSIKPLKKKLFFTYARLFNVFNRVIWHASSEQEAIEIKNVFGTKSNVKVALNLSHPLVSEIARPAKKIGELNAFFLSRISPKKNLHTAIRLLSQLPQSISVTYTIIGPIEDEAYYHSCEALQKNAPSNIRFIQTGAVQHHQLPDLLSQQHILFLPTLHENFGHVILEALSAGCPAVISEATPWRNLQHIHAGFDLDLKDEKSVVKTLEYFAEMDDATFQQWSTGARQLADQHLNDPAVIAANRNLFGL